jgi:hypothetical protein
LIFGQIQHLIQVLIEKGPVGLSGTEFHETSLPAPRQSLAAVFYFSMGGDRHRSRARIGA